MTVRDCTSRPNHFPEQEIGGFPLKPAIALIPNPYSSLFLVLIQLFNLEQVEQEIYKPDDAVVCTRDYSISPIRCQNPSGT
jgi:hypothetical protein